MTTQTTTLPEFLERRLAEDEAAARKAAEFEGGDFVMAALPMPIFEGLKPGFPARVLADVEAKRAIVEMHSPSDSAAEACDTCAEWKQPWPCDTLRALALPYVDHPEFDEAWAL